MTATATEPEHRVDCCAVCRRPIEQPATGRRRLTCSDSCRQQLRRDRQHLRAHGFPSAAQRRRDERAKR